VEEVDAPVPAPHGAIVRVEASGLCRSDWHGWLGHDPDVTLPHVPGHELAGQVEAVGSAVIRWAAGDRVTVPFVCACGTCPSCAAGQQQVCERQTQPGFTGWGSFAELVALDHADVNLVALPDAVSDVSAAALGCRLGTAYRAVLTQGRVRPGQWVAVHGCGGVGLSAVLVGVATGARVVAVDVSAAALDLAASLGAEVVVDGRDGDSAETVREVSSGGVHVSIDALGSPQTFAASVRSLRRRGRHVQVGLLPVELGDPSVAMARVIAHELEIVGSHGMPAHDYDTLLGMVTSGRLRPDLLVSRVVPLDRLVDELPAMGRPGFPAGITVARPGESSPRNR
jgi:alcohol dehydrogenase